PRPGGEADAGSPGRIARSARLLPPAARPEDAGRPLPAAVRDGAAGRPVPRAAPGGGAGEPPGPAQPSPPCPAARAVRPLRPHAELRAEGRRGGGEAEARE